MSEEPGYIARRREQQEKSIAQEKAAEAERKKAAEQSYRDKIIAAFQRIMDNALGYQKENARESKRHRRLDRIQMRLEGRRFGVDKAAVIGAYIAAFLLLIQDGFLWWSIIDARTAADKQYMAMTAQQNVMQGQLDQMRVEQRPWLSLVSERTGLMVKIVEPLTFSSRGGVLAVAFALRNTGKTPALGVRWHSKIVGIKGGRFENDELKDDLVAYCEPIRKQPPGILETTMFPMDVYVEQRVWSAIYPKDIAATLASKARSINDPTKAEFAFIGCVDYMDSQSVHHQTRYAFLLGMPRKIGTAIGWMGLIKPEGTYPQMQLIELLQSAD